MLLLLILDSNIHYTLGWKLMCMCVEALRQKTHVFFINAVYKNVDWAVRLQLNGKKEKRLSIRISFKYCLCVCVCDFVVCYHSESWRYIFSIMVLIKFVPLPGFLFVCWLRIIMRTSFAVWPKIRRLQSLYGFENEFDFLTCTAS